MSREIKFRVYNKELKQIEVVGALDWDHQGKIVTCNTDTDKLYVYPPESLILMQFTGLLDKNGKEIYEGDFVECSMSFEGGSLPHMGEIVYNDTFGAFATKNLAGETLLHNHIVSSFEVIGDIFSNPELMEGGE